MDFKVLVISRMLHVVWFWWPAKVLTLKTNYNLCCSDDSVTIKDYRSMNFAKFSAKCQGFSTRYLNKLKVTFIMLNISCVLIPLYLLHWFVHKNIQQSITIVNIFIIIIIRKRRKNYVYRARYWSKFIHYLCNIH